MTEGPQVPASVEQDIAAIARIGALPKILEVVAEITGLGFTRVQASERVGARFSVTLPRAKSVTQRAARPE
jgi:hypothetical protein